MVIVLKGGHLLLQVPLVVVVDQHQRTRNFLLIASQAPRMSFPNLKKPEWLRESTMLPLPRLLRK